MTTQAPRLLRATIATCALLLLGGCGGDDDDGVFDRGGFSFSFEYPDGFTETEEITIDQQLGNQAAAQAGVALSENDSLIVQEFELTVEIDEDNLDLAKEEVDRLFENVQGPTPEAEETSVAGLPALVYDGVDVPSRDATSRLVFIFDGDREYLINCQSTEDATDEIAEACDQALETFEVN